MGGADPTLASRIGGKLFARHWFGSRSVRQTLFAGFGFSVLIGGGLSAVLYYQARAEIEQARAVDYVHRVLHEVHQAQINIDRMQAGYRGFLITGRDDSLDPYINGRKQLTQHTDAVAYLSSDPVLLERFQQLRSRVARWEESVIHPGIALRRSYPAGTLSWVNSGVGAEHMQRIDQTVQALVTDLRGELDRLHHQRDWVRERLPLAVAFAAALGISLVAAIAVLLARSIVLPLREVAANASRLYRATGAAEANRPRGDELALVTQAASDMIGTLSAVEAQSLAVATGNLSDPVLDHDAGGSIGESFQAMVAKLRDNVDAVSRLAGGDLKVNVVPEHDNDAIGQVTARLVQSLRRKDEDLRTRGLERERLVQTQEFEARLYRALEMAHTDDEIMKVVRDVVEYRGLNDGVEVIMADDSRAHMACAMSQMEEGLGCGVRTPSDCNAVRSAHVQTFASSKDFDACPYFRGRGDGKDLAAACVPLNVMGRASGVVHVLSSNGWSKREEDLDFLTLLATRVGERLSVARAFARSQAQAATDPLTGLLNRRALGEKAQMLRARGERYVASYGDLDHFKNLNDTYGHDTGDRALRLFARVLRETLRPGDLIGRWGGEEFVIVLPGQDSAGAVVALDRVRAALAESLKSGSTPEFTASFGVAEAGGGEDLEDILNAADAALLEAKRNGRDRVECAAAAAQPREDADADRQPVERLASAS